MSLKVFIQQSLKLYSLSSEMELRLYELIYPHYLTLEYFFRLVFVCFHDIGYA